MSQKGYSLVEIMIASAIGTVLILIVSGVAVIGFSQMNSLRDRLAAEENLNRIELVLRSTLGQAVDVRSADITYGSPFDVMGWDGGLRANFNWNTIAAAGSDWNTIGHFYRETGGTASSGANGNGTLLPTALFYRRPSATTSGVLFYHMGGNGVVNLTPSYAEGFVDRLSLIEMTKNNNDAYGRVVSVRFRVAVRYHDFSSTSRIWCPSADIAAATAGCVSSARYRDLEKEFTILLRDNLLKASGTAGMTGTLSEERTMGFLYFFRLINPVRL